MTLVETLDAARGCDGGHKVQQAAARRLAACLPSGFCAVAVGAVRGRARPVRAQPNANGGERGHPRGSEPRRCGADGPHSPGIGRSCRADAKTLGIASFYLRAVCQNRNLWGVEDFEEITIRHSKYAASPFANEAVLALTRFVDSSPMPFINGVKAARERIVARNDDDRTEFLRKRGFSKAETAKIIDIVLTEEGRKPESAFDFVQGITAVARDKMHQDARLDFETRAKKLFERAA
ncbi:hypothetical protein MJC1_01533 [Methylocystis sp. MJC1]|jgi:hypothetical protein|nr:hypothetical protein MJC1_01533 [Methylocystis sp. MJC1]